MVVLDVRKSRQNWLHHSEVDGKGAPVRWKQSARNLYLHKTPIALHQSLVHHLHSAIRLCGAFSQRSLIAAVVQVPRCSCFNIKVGLDIFTGWAPH